MKIRAIQKNVLVHNMNFDERTTNGGIVLLKDDMKTIGVRPRWGQVYTVGSEETDVSPGQWVLIAHGRWTRGVKINGITVHRIDNDDILLVSDEKPVDEQIGND